MGSYSASNAISLVIIHLSAVQRLATRTVLIGIQVRKLLKRRHSRDAKATPDGCYRIIDYAKNDTFNCCNRDKPLQNPCMNSTANKCATNQRCVLKIPKCDIPNGVGCSFEPQPTCEPIYHCQNKPTKCKDRCYPIYDQQGCAGCFCDPDFKNPCASTDCMRGYDCVLRKVTCITTPCNPVAACRKQCVGVPVTCPKGCLNIIDNDGCQQCYCCNACVNKKCGKNEECALEPIFCITTPCNPRPVCIPKMK